MRRERATRVGRGSVDRFRWSEDLAIFHVKRLHHLTDESVRQHNRRIAVIVGEFERKNREIGHLL